MRRQASIALEIVASLLTPRAWLQWLRVARFGYITQARQRGLLEQADGVRISPTAGFRNAQRIRIGAGTHIGEGCKLWAGDSVGRITIGRGCLFAPDVYVTASDYGLEAGRAILDQPKREADVVIGDDVWLGIRVVVTAGVTIGDGCVVGAGAIVTRSLPPGAIAAGVPARVVGQRQLRASA